MPTMYDAVDISAIPPDAEHVGCYVNGKYRNDAEAADRFPAALLVPIWVYWPTQTDAAGKAAEAVAITRQLGLAPGSTIVLDVEASDAMAGCPFAFGWVDAIRAEGYSPTIYTSLSTWTTLVPAAPDDWWIAHYTGNPHLIGQSAATQWTAPETGSPGDYDISECQDGWPRRPAAPVDPWPLELAVAVGMVG